MAVLKVVLDTNIILSSVSRRSPYRVVMDELFRGAFDVYVTTEILLEYEEKLTANFDKELAEMIISTLLLKKNVKKTESFFDLNLIAEDVDDNKFVNCAFANNVHYLVSNDKHFNVLKLVSFPSINVIKIAEFCDLLAANAA